jgi:hypothetical protein
MACLCCGAEIPVKQGPNGTINAACAWCDFPAWAKKGTEAARIILGKMKPKAAPPEPKPPAPPEPKKAPARAAPATPPPPQPAPAPAKTVGGFFHGL